MHTGNVGRNPFALEHKRIVSTIALQTSFSYSHRTQVQYLLCHVSTVFYFYSSLRPEAESYSVINHNASAFLKRLSTNSLTNYLTNSLTSALPVGSIGFALGYHTLEVGARVDFAPIRRLPAHVHTLALAVTHTRLRWAIHVSSDVTNTQCLRSTSEPNRALLVCADSVWACVQGDAGECNDRCFASLLARGEEVLTGLLRAERNMEGFDKTLGSSCRRTGRFDVALGLGPTFRTHNVHARHGIRRSTRLHECSAGIGDTGTAALVALLD